MKDRKYPWPAVRAAQNIASELNLSIFSLAEKFMENPHDAILNRVEQAIVDLSEVYIFLNKEKK